MEKLGIGLIGCGGFGRKVAKDVLEQSDRIEVRGLFDPSAKSIRLSRAQFGNDAVVHKTLDSIVTAQEIDWVMIASWNCFHKEHSIAALEAGKHVFCQKPLATTFEDALAMKRAWEKSGKMFAQGFTLRFSPRYRKIRQLIEDGVIGEFVSMEFNGTLGFQHGGSIMGNWRRLQKNAGTHLLEKCCHDIDLANWMAGAKPSRVASFGGLNFFKPENKKYQRRLGKNAKGILAYGTFPGRKHKNAFTSDKDIVDNQVAIIEYENGGRATFHANMNAGIPERRMYILGTEGAIRTDPKQGPIEVCRIGFDEKTEQISLDARGGHGGGDEMLAKELSETMLDGAEPMAGFIQGFDAAVTCFAIDRSMDSGRMVSLAPYWKRGRRE